MMKFERTEQAGDQLAEMLYRLKDMQTGYDTDTPPEQNEQLREMKKAMVFVAEEIKVMISCNDLQIQEFNEMNR